MKLKIFDAHGVDDIKSLDQKVNSWIENEGVAKIAKTNTSTYFEEEEFGLHMLVSVWYLD
jgi:hypothetical protein